MFNLNHAISEWRQEMAAGGLKNRKVLDELENHLREDIERWMVEGKTAEQAFEIATQSIGPARSLNAEFDKVGRKHSMRQVRLKTLVCVTLVASLGLFLAFTSSRA